MTRGANGGTSVASSTVTGQRNVAALATASAVQGYAGQNGGYGYSSTVGNGGASTATAAATSTMTQANDQVSATATAVGGNAGSANAAGDAGAYSGGTGGAATATASGSAKGGTLTITASQIAGSGGQGGDGANGGAGASTTMAANAVSGTDAGGTLNLNEMVFAGSGGITDYGTAGVGGMATANLTVNDKTASALSAIILAQGGAGGYATSGGTDAGGGSRLGHRIDYRGRGGHGDGHRHRRQCWLFQHRRLWRRGEHWPDRIGHQRERVGHGDRGCRLRQWRRGERDRDGYGQQRPGERGRDRGRHRRRAHCLYLRRHLRGRRRQEPGFRVGGDWQWLHAQHQDRRGDRRRAAGQHGDAGHPGDEFQHRHVYGRAGQSDILCGRGAGGRSFRLRQRRGDHEQQQLLRGQSDAQDMAGALEIGLFGGSSNSGVTGVSLEILVNGNVLIDDQNMSLKNATALFTNDVVDGGGLNNSGGVLTVQVLMSETGTGGGFWGGVVVSG